MTSGRGDARFHHAADVDPGSGWTVHTLAYRDRARSRSVTARVVPQAGSNLISLVVDGIELLRVPPSVERAAGLGFGVPILYPTPNRVRDARFTFEGRELVFEANERSHFIHGLVHGAAWRAGTPAVTPARAALRTFLDFEPGFAGFDRFPIRSRIAVTFTLHPDGASIAFEVENRDHVRLPFGFALHPYFRILGERAATFVRVPATHHMEAIDLLPTGRLETLDGSRHDLRTPRSLAALEVDDVFFGLAPDHPVEYEARDRNVRTTLEASALFTHAVLFARPDLPFFCLESQTCATDAHNLHARGLVRAAHLTVLEPGARASGSVRIRVNPLRAAS